MRLSWFLVLIATAACAWAQENRIDHGGFETVAEGKPAGWGGFWSRAAGAGEMAVVAESHSGERAVRIVHRGQDDWSLTYGLNLAVVPDDIVELSGWLTVQGEGGATLCVTTRDSQDKVLDWSFGAVEARQTGPWRRLESRFVIPAGVATIQPRLIGHGPATVTADDLSLIGAGNLSKLRTAPLESTYTLANPALKLQFDPDSGTLTVESGGKYTQTAGSPDIYISGVKPAERSLELEAWYMPSASKGTIRILLEPEKPEFTVELEFDATLPRLLNYPAPFVTQPGQSLIVPLNEGIRYPVDDPAIKPMTLVCYGGHGICMAFFGAVQDNSGAGLMTLIETPDDAILRLDRGKNGFLAGAIQWQAQKGRFGYPRKLRYIAFQKGGHVALCKRYRHYAQEQGLLKTLKQKQTENPNVDLLIGAANIWNWDSDPVTLVPQMQALGMERILWSRGGNGAAMAALNGMPGVLTSRYDLYQDLMDPEVVREKLNNRGHGDWTQAGWPADLMLDANGDWIKGWGVDARDGQRYYCGVLCDRQAVNYARQRVPAELKTIPYRARFIDTTTASPWRECWSENHPMTRTDSRVWKMKLLDSMSGEAGLVTGSETGHDAAVPFVHFFEGMLSLGPYRVAEAGRDMQKIIDEVPAQISTFQVGTKYRLPLWELVYHDCVVAQWYWGDYNNKLPAVWLKRDLFNLLYGTPPMYMFTRDFWRDNQARFVESYQRICPTIRRVGYHEMTDHRFLTPDGAIQQSRFANGVTVTVNFADTPHTLSDGTVLKGLSSRMQ